MHLNEWYTVYQELESTAKVLPLKPFLEDEMRNHVSQSMGWNQPNTPFKRSNVVMILALPIECMSSTASSIGKSSDTLSEFRALKSTQSRRVPSFLLTQTIDRLFLRQILQLNQVAQAPLSAHQL
ncbi:hypothetical protein TNCV_3158271 [Trichonephila clavipes]|nr:hypothetical protein TNCV_3158271 [Trichonephila clavipes]